MNSDTPFLKYLVPEGCAQKLKPFAGFNILWLTLQAFIWEGGSLAPGEWVPRLTCQGWDLRPTI